VNQQLDLKELERKAYRSTFQDGMLDIFFGLMLMGGALGFLLSHVGLGPPLRSVIGPALACIVFYAGKRFITVPRIGRVRFGPKRQIARRKAALILAFFVALTFFLVILKFFGKFPEAEGTWFSGLTMVILIDFGIIVVPISILAYLKDFPRLYYMGIMAGLSWPLAEILIPYVADPYNAVIAYGATGAVILVPGVVLLVRFMRENPRTPAGVPAGGEHDAE